jgi:tetratricopeptide (TPR) repeat protein
MSAPPCQSRDRGFIESARPAFCGLLLAWALSTAAQPAPVPGSFVVLEIENSVEVLRAGAATWDSASAAQTLYPGDQIRTAERSRALLRLANQTTLRVGELTLLRIPEAPRPGRLALDLFRGALHFFHRDQPGLFEIRTETVSAVVRGTEFTVQEDVETGSALVLLEGELLLSNAWGTLELGSGESAVAEPGKPPRRTAVLDLVLAVQWCLYYPAIVDPDELPWSGEDVERLRAVLEAYRAGDLQAAVALWPTQPASASQAESEAAKVFQAAVLLAVGGVAEAEGLLDEVAVGDGAGGNSTGFIAAALRRMIDLVRLREVGSTRPPAYAAEWLAESYARQAVGDLDGARAAALEATRVSPEFGFAWVRLAELEFSHGRVRRAETALAEGMRLSPRNAQALALRGFLEAAHGRTREALNWFERAIARDPALANGWLGRGLCRIRQGELPEGLADLQVAATVEPQRSVLRSYLAKGFAEDGQSELARRELERARELDPGDPTPWFYAALIDHRHNRTTEALRNLRESTRRNDNRQLYRSRLLLDQDRAVRGANLAQVYADAGMSDTALQESARAVADDYANALAHLNLAASYEALRDPTRFNLRYDTLWLSEHLMASLLAPVGAVPLSQNLSQLEYTRLFERDGFGLNSTLELLGTGEFRALASQFGAFGGTSYALDLDYGYRQGVFDNDWVSRIEWYSRIQQQLTPDDSVLLLVKYQDYESGDNFQYYDPNQGMPGYTFRDSQKPILLVGGQHQWDPGMRTLYLAGRLVDDREITDPDRSLPAVFELPGGTSAAGWPAFDHDYASQFEAYGLELQQAWQRERHTDILGGRFLAGDVEARDDLVLNDPAWNDTGLLEPAYPTRVNESVRHTALYYYHTWRPAAALSLQGGIAYEHAVYPINFRRPPLLEGEASTSAWLPKGALVWIPNPAVTVRGIYAESLGEIVYGQSFRLEPTQLAGFGQTYRTLASDSVIGSTEAALHQVAAGALDLRLGQRTYGTLEGGSLTESGERLYGLLEGVAGIPTEPASPGAFLERFDYEETYGRLGLHQVLGSGWFAGANYRYTHSSLDLDRPELAGINGIRATSHESAHLHEGRVSLQFSPPAGFFARFEVAWIAQDNSDPALEDDAFPQLDFYLGHRFAQRRGEVILGFLNLTDHDYRINPLTPHPEWPRQRTAQLRVRFSF